MEEVKPEIVYPNWFEKSAKENFEFFLKEFAGKPDLTFLQIGAFTGDASVWMLKNILTDSTSLLIDVDTWGGSDEELHKTMDFDDVLRVYDKKISPYKKTVRFKMKSQDYFAGNNERTFDFIYIDGDHTTPGVLSDAVMAYPLLKQGGIMAFDDYTWLADSGLEIDSPRPAINFFYWAYQKNLELLIANSQFWVKKK